MRKICCITTPGLRFRLLLLQVPLATAIIQICKIYNPVIECKSWLTLCVIKNSITHNVTVDETI
ncbi:hypothetical protein BLOT_009907 [Blomia tropicalis]|nr:hypothetical protein BLOT_009907 [Blomia tropicalis]